MYEYIDQGSIWKNNEGEAITFFSQTVLLFTILYNNSATSIHAKPQKAFPDLGHNGENVAEIMSILMTSLKASCAIADILLVTVIAKCLSPSQHVASKCLKTWRFPDKFCIAILYQLKTGAVAISSRAASVLTRQVKENHRTVHEMCSMSTVT